MSSAHTATIGADKGAPDGRIGGAVFSHLTFAPVLLGLRLV